MTLYEHVFVTDYFGETELGIRANIRFEIPALTGGDGGSAALPAVPAAPMDRPAAPALPMDQPATPDLGGVGDVGGDVGATDNSFADTASVLFGLGTDTGIDNAPLIGEVGDAGGEDFIPFFSRSLSIGAEDQPEMSVDDQLSYLENSGVVAPGAPLTSTGTDENPAIGFNVTPDTSIWQLAQQTLPAGASNEAIQNQVTSIINYNIDQGTISSGNLIQPGQTLYFPSSGLPDFGQVQDATTSINQQLEGDYWDSSIGAAEHASRLQDPSTVTSVLASVSDDPEKRDAFVNYLNQLYPNGLPTDIQGVVSPDAPAGTAPIVIGDGDNQQVAYDWAGNTDAEQWARDHGWSDGSIDLYGTQVTGQGIFKDPRGNVLINTEVLGLPAGSGGTDSWLNVDEAKAFLTDPKNARYLAQAQVRNGWDIPVS